MSLGRTSEFIPRTDNFREQESYFRNLITESIKGVYISGAGNIASKDAVYISADNTILKAQANAAGTTHVIGFADGEILNGKSGNVITQGLIKDILSGATAGDVYYLDSATPGAISTSQPVTSGHYIYQVGVAKNDKDLQVNIMLLGQVP